MSTNPFNTPELQDSHLNKERKQEWIEETYDKGADASSHSSYIGRPIKKRQLIFLSALATVFLLVLLGRAFFLQMVHGKTFFESAEGNRIRIQRIHAERGIIFDRNGRPLVENVPQFNVTIVPADLPRNNEEKDEILKQVANLVGIPLDEVEYLLEKRGSLDRYQPVRISDNISYEKALLLSAESATLPGVDVETGIGRSYEFIPKDDSVLVSSLSHILGYTGRINQSEWDDYRDKGYMLDDRIGKTGIEASFEQQLRGEYGKKQIEVNALGKENVVLAQEEPEPGKNIALTIDFEMQSAVEQYLKKALDELKLAKGAAVVLNPQNGEIISLVSLPSFDNNKFSQGIDSESYQQLINDGNNPLFSRAISGEYPSGSTIKMVVGAAALEEGLINRWTSYLSTGGLKINQWFFPDWRAGGHGQVNIVEALAESVNTFFYIIGGGFQDLNGLGVAKLNDYYSRFGFGKKLGVELPGEGEGLVPSEAWKQEAKDEIWYIGDTYHLAIGQGDFLATPLQITAMTSVFANGGDLHKPHLYLGTVNRQGEVSREAAPDPIKENVISKDNVKVIREGLRAAVQWGSARRLSTLPITSAGKTGTAQWSSVKEPHAWYTGFAPFNNPEIVVTILVEEGEGGAKAAVPVAKKIINWYYNNRM